MKTKMRTLKLGLVALLLTTLVQSSFAAPPRTGIEGQALAYQPGFAVEVSPGNWLGDGGFHYPVAASFTVWLPHSRRPVGHFSTATDGSFQVSLPPGRYIIVPDTQFWLAPLPASFEVIVTPRHYTATLLIYYQRSGITLMGTSP